MKLLCRLATIAVTLGSTQLALAQSNLGKPMDVVLGVERAFGFYTGEAEWDFDNGVKEERDSQGFALGWSHTGQPFPVFVPRFGFDIFVIESLSVGSGFGFVSQDYDPGDGRGGFIFAPRVGYFIDFNEHFGFWPRGGFTVYDLDDDDQSQGLLTLEGYFTFAPREGFGFHFGPVIDLGFTGEYEDVDYSEWSIGVAIGLFGWL